MLEISHLSVEYTLGKQKIPVLEDLSLSLCEGGIYTLIGPSGCGKSTLLKTLCGLIPPVKGTITFRGETLSPKNHLIGLVLQNDSLLAWQTVQENILLACRVKKRPYDAAFFSDLLDVLKLKPLLKRYPHELSGGQRQRAAIARVFLLKPDILLLDEPFSALDAFARDELQTLFLELWQKNPTTTLFVTHSMEEAVYLGQTILLFRSAPRQTLEMLENPCFLLPREEEPQTIWQWTQQLREKLKEESI